MCDHEIGMWTEGGEKFTFYQLFHQSGQVSIKCAVLTIPSPSDYSYFFQRSLVVASASVSSDIRVSTGLATISRGVPNLGCRGAAMGEQLAARSFRLSRMNVHPTRVDGATV